MTVAELINELGKVEDKTLKVGLFCSPTLAIGVDEVKVKEDIEIAYDDYITDKMQAVILR